MNNSRSNRLIKARLPASPGKTSGRMKQMLRPRFDPEYRSLWLGESFVRRYTVLARLQTCILAAFDELNWCRRIDDPLPPNGTSDPKARLRDIIHNLNASQDAIHFYADGTGCGVCWELVRPNPSTAALGRGRREA